MTQPTTLQQLVAIICYLEIPNHHRGLDFDDMLVYLEKGRDEEYITIGARTHKVLRIQFNVGTGARLCDYVEVFVDETNQYHHFIRDLIDEIYHHIPGISRHRKQSVVSLILAKVKVLATKR